MEMRSKMEVNTGFNIKKIRWDIVLIVVSVLCFGIYGMISYNNWKLEKNANDVKMKLDEIKEIVIENTEIEQELQKRTPYDALFDKNSDMIGWLKIPNTTIDYPVMQTLENEEYYLYKDFFGNNDKNGTLFMDTDSHLEDLCPNLLIHGHHMKSGAMFGNLSEYLNEDYCEQHPRIYFYTKEDERIYEVISVFTSKVYNNKTDKFLYYNYFSFKDEAEFEEYYKNIKELSVYDTKVTAEYGDEFITLSTCSYHTKNGRLAVIGKLLEKKQLNHQ